MSICPYFFGAAAPDLAKSSMCFERDLRRCLATHFWTVPNRTVCEIIKDYRAKDWPLNHNVTTLTAIAFALLTTQASAGCEPGFDPFTVCDIQGRDTTVHVCHDDKEATYSYGVYGEAPQLFLSKPIAMVDYHPWDAPAATSGSITFNSGEYAYEIASGFTSESFAYDIPSVTHFGWITVTRNGDVLDKLECIPEPSRYPFGGTLYDRMVAIGMVWNGYERGWSDG
jgi:hypothetical protein